MSSSLSEYHNWLHARTLANMRMLRATQARYRMWSLLITGLFYISAGVGSFFLIQFILAI